MLSPIGSSVKTGNNPTAITSDLHGRLLYAANLDDGTISAFGINRADGSIFTAPGSPFATGDSPLNLLIDRATKFLFVANNGSSSISVFHINRTDASLKLLPGSPVDTPDPPINLALAPSGKFLYAATGTNGIEVLSVSSTGVLALVDQQASVTGNLSNLAISPNGKFLFAVDDDATVSAYTIDAVTGKLALIAGSPFAAGDQPSTIAVDPSGPLRQNDAKLCSPMNGSAPSRNGCWRKGDANVLSTTSGAPTRWASSATARMSTTWSRGFVGVSIQTSRVRSSIAPATSSAGAQSQTYPFGA